MPAFRSVALLLREARVLDSAWDGTPQQSPRLSKWPVNSQRVLSCVGPGRDGEGEWIDKINHGNVHLCSTFLRILAEDSPYPNICGDGKCKKKKWVGCPVLPISKLSKLFHVVQSESVCLGGGKWQTIETFCPFYFTAKRRAKPSN